MDKIEIVLAQWKTCVEMADSLSKRRAISNGFFVSLNFSMLSINSFVDNKIGCIIAGFAICIVWFLCIRDFALLSEAKFKIILELERNLPVKAFDCEWRYLKTKKYRGLIKSEKFILSIFIIIYFILLIYMGVSSYGI